MATVSAGRFVAAMVLVAGALACGPRAGTIPPGSADQSIADAMRLVCDAPSRADRDRTDASRSDKIAGHLADGIGHPRVLATVEGWKTDGIAARQLAALVREAGLRSCELQREAE